MKDRQMTDDILAKTAMVDRALDSLPRPAPASFALKAAILAIPAQVPQKSHQKGWLQQLINGWPFGTILGGPVPQIGGLIFACILGLVMGYSDLLINPWGNPYLTEMALGLDTPQGITSLEGVGGK